MDRKGISLQQWDGIERSGAEESREIICILKSSPQLLPGCSGATGEEERRAESPGPAGVATGPKERAAVQVVGSGGSLRRRSLQCVPAGERGAQKQRSCVGNDPEGWGPETERLAFVSDGKERLEAEVPIGHGLGGVGWTAGCAGREFCSEVRGRPVFGGGQRREGMQATGLGGATQRRVWPEERRGPRRCRAPPRPRLTTHMQRKETPADGNVWPLGTAPSATRLN